MSRADDRDQLRRALDSMLDAGVRDAIRDRCRARSGTEGARQAAEIIAAAIASPPERTPAVAARVAVREPYAWLPRFLRWRAVRLHRRLLRRTGRPQPPPHAAGPPSQRPLVLTDGAVSGPGATEAVEALTTWIAARPDGAVILAAADAVATLSRRGISVELALAEDAADVADRVDLAAYVGQKTEALRRAYGCGPVVRWPEAEPPAELTGD
jgi:hypothetical protein